MCFENRDNDILSSFILLMDQDQPISILWSFKNDLSHCSQSWFSDL